MADNNNLIGIASLINAGGGLLGSLLEAIGKGKAAKELKRETKPSAPYYETFRTLPLWQELLGKTLLGSMTDRLGADVLNKWGINPQQILTALSLSRGQALGGSSPYRGLLSKYGFYK